MLDFCCCAGDALLVADVEFDGDDLGDYSIGRYCGGLGFLGEL